MNEILQKSIFGPFDMYRLLTCGFMLVLYGSYSYIKKKNPKKLIYISNITLILSVIYIMTNLLLNYLFDYE